MEDSKENQEIKKNIRKMALINAISHGGKAQPNPVLGRLLSEKPSLKTRIRELTPSINGVIEEVNSIPLSEQRKIVENMWPDALVREKEKTEERKLPPLPNAEKYKEVVTRFAPNPDCVLHLGSARAIILSHEYAKIYGGRFILRFEDTDPRLKRSSLQFFDLIRKDLEWLGCRWSAEYIQSDRLEIYYEYAEKLIKKGFLYICTCNPEDFRNLIKQRKPCPHRNVESKENMDRWKSFQDGTYSEGEAVTRLKTDLNHSNPAIRDWPALRIIDTKKYPHPRVGDKYRVWPLYNFSAGIDDHLMGITHIIRGKEHLTNQHRQEFLYRYLNWDYPEAIHYGRLKIQGAFLSKSKISLGVKEGIYQGWDDPRLATFLAMKRRGISPQAVKSLIIDIGPGRADITLSWENLYAYNRKIVDPVADRFFFVSEPVKLVVEDTGKTFTAHIPLHPDHPERGSRILEVEPKNNEAHLLISSRDADRLKSGSLIRLMELFNIRITRIQDNQISAQFHSESYDEARRLGVQLIHWIPEKEGVPCEVMMPDGSVISGLAERRFGDISKSQVVQFERFGFVRVDNVDNKIIVFFAHK